MSPATVSTQNIRKTHQSMMKGIVGPQTYARDKRHRHLFPLSKGLQLGVFGFFLWSKYAWFVRRICHLHLLINTHEKPNGMQDEQMHVRKDLGCWTNFVCIFFSFFFLCVRVCKDPNIPAPWLMTQLHRAVWEVWYLRSKSVSRTDIQADRRTLLIINNIAVC